MQLHSVKRGGRAGSDLIKELENQIEDNELLRDRRRDISAIVVQAHARAGEQAAKVKRETGRCIYITLANFVLLLRKVK